MSRFQIFFFMDLIHSSKRNHLIKKCVGKKKKFFQENIGSLFINVSLPRSW